MMIIFYRHLLIQISDSNHWQYLSTMALRLNNGLGVKDIREQLGIGEKALQRIIKNSDILYLVVIKVFENHNLSIVDC